ncbi:DUF6653 family protein [Streptosporangium sp. NPDC003464]
MTDEAWKRHANPWSVYTRSAAIPGMILAARAGPSRTGLPPGRSLWRRRRTRRRRATAQDVPARAGRTARACARPHRAVRRSRTAEP